MPAGGCPKQLLPAAAEFSAPEIEQAAAPAHRSGRRNLTGPVNPYQAFSACSESIQTSWLGSIHKEVEHLATTRNAQLAKLALGIVGAAALAGITGQISESGTAKADGAVASVPSQKEEREAPDHDDWWRLGDDDDDDDYRREHETPRPGSRSPRSRTSSQLPRTRSGHS